LTIKQYNKGENKRGGLIVRKTIGRIK
jgi:hypothetical protein